MGSEGYGQDDEASSRSKAMPSEPYVTRAFTEGMAARKVSKANPYMKGTDNHKEWSAGWRAENENARPR